MAMVGHGCISHSVITSVSAVEVDQTQSKQLVAIGASLDEQQRQETLKLLGVSPDNTNKIVYVDGEMVNKYVKDGSTNATNVYSSASIEQMPQGHGVQVQIVTPDNILNVTPLTYQNAAITAGAKNVNIRVATVNPVTGGGALAGVYELLSNSGVKMNNTNIQVAQNEIRLISEIGTITKLDQSKINQVISEIKIYIINHKEKLDEAALEKYIAEVFNKYGVDISKYPDAVTILLNFAKEFSETDTDQDTIDQLEQSITPVWPDVLSAIEGTVTLAEFKQREQVTFEDQAEINPIIQALTNKFYADVEGDMRGESIYSLTHAIETMQPSLTSKDKIALNALRTEIYYYSQAMNQEMFDQSDLKETWLNVMTSFEQVKVSHPEIAEMFTQIGLKTGMMPQVYPFKVVGQNESVVYIEIIEDNPDKTLIHRYQYDLTSGEIMNYSETGSTAISVFSYADALGMDVSDQHSATEIPTDYKVPEEMITESIYDYPTEETTVEETTEESSEELSEETTVEELPEELPEESIEVTNNFIEQTSLPVQDSLMPGDSDNSEE